MKTSRIAALPRMFPALAESRHNPPPLTVTHNAGAVEMSPRAYRPELDVLRFFAFFLVFAHHSIPRVSEGLPRFLPVQAKALLIALANSFGFGLSIFFMLSAFLITDLLRREKERTGTVHMGNFYIRRILRIWPLYAFGILLGVGFSFATHSLAELPMFAMYALMVGNWFFTGPIWPGNPFTPLWSISIEEQFYLFWPATMRFLSRRGMFGACATMLVVAVGVQYYLGSQHALIDTQVWTNSFAQFEMFSVGALIALALNGHAPVISQATRWAGFAAAAFLLFAATYSLQAKTIGVAASGGMVVAGWAVVSAACAIILLCAIGGEFKNPRLIYLGKISYGLYVFHLLGIFLGAKIAGRFIHNPQGAAFMVTRDAIGLLICILLAAISYRYLETPFLRLKDRFAFVHSRPI